MKKLKTAALLSSLALLSSMGFAHAGSAQANLLVQATVQASCKIKVVSDINFGDYFPDQDSFAQGLLQVTCIKDVTPTISLRDGGAAEGDRFLSFVPAPTAGGTTSTAGTATTTDAGTTTGVATTTNTDTIAYTLFQPTDGLSACASASAVWGSSDTNSLKLQKSLGYVGQEISVCGKIAAGQTTVGAGTYTGTVIAQVDY
jgi:spore coat protein U-like protein